MDYTQFISAAAELVKRRLPADAQVQVHDVIKNNSLHLDGLTIFYGKSGVSPNIYLNHYYEDYLKGQSLDEITDKILSIFKQFKQQSLFYRQPAKNLKHPDRGSFFYRLVNYRKNEELLKKIPYVPYLDLAITFHYLINTVPDGIESFCITNQMLEMWQLSGAQLYDYAAVNTKRLFPGCIRPLNELLADMMNRDMGDFFQEPSFRTDLQENSLNMMYVLSTQNGIHGAAAILYPGLLSHFAQKLQSSFFVIPSSIHELLLVPQQLAPSVLNLNEMIQEVNKTQVPLEDILSDHAYFYQNDTQELMIPLSALKQKMEI